MDLQTKDKIVAHAKRYMQEKGVSQAFMAKLCSVNPSYFSNLMNGNYQYKSSDDRQVDIADKYFATIAQVIGLSLEKTFWDILPTPQFTLGIATLENAHQNATTEEGRGAFKMLIGESGSGKTTLIRQYCKAHPKDAFLVTINDYDQVHDILGEIARNLDFEMPRKHGAQLRAVGNELKRRALKGEQNILILDEGENTHVPGLKAYKAIYDMVKGYCAFVIAGTEELPKMLDKLLRKNTPGIKQFVRRFKANMVYLPTMDRKYALFLERVEDKALRELLIGLADNYGELHDYLEPALYNAYKDGVPLTKEYFCTMYGIATKSK